MPVKLRQYRDSDYIEVKKNLIEGGIFDKYVDTRKNFKSKSCRNPESMVVAELDGKIIGSVFAIEDDWVAYLFRLVVKKEFRGKDVGLRLSSYAEKILKEKGYKYVSVFISINNEISKRFALDNGYEVEGDKFELLTKEL
jgi:ribosomal protein S18 acetylase RimI-like enzyme